VSIGRPALPPIDRTLSNGPPDLGICAHAA